MLQTLSYLKDALFEVLFPRVCMFCGFPLVANQYFLCSECIANRFETALESRETKLNKPECIQKRIALWQFDKGGYLQELMHALKYQRLTNIGVDIGAALGRKILNDHEIDADDLVIIPVPLHKHKKRSRGFNQAYFISKGIADVINGSIIDEEAVVRSKNTKSQTGFNLERRRLNIADAFQVCSEESILAKNLLIVDDVFTTGATAYELARVLKEAGAHSIYLGTVAQA